MTTQTGRTKRKASPAFMQPYRLSAALEQIVGKGPLPRPVVVKQVWEYIKRKGLQDAVNKRMVNLDEPLAAVFRTRADQTQVGMLELNRVLSGHMERP